MAITRTLDSDLAQRGGRAGPCSSSCGPQPLVLVLGACESVVALAPVGLRVLKIRRTGAKKKASECGSCPRCKKIEGRGRPPRSGRDPPLDGVSPPRRHRPGSEDEIEGTTATRIEVEHARASRWETAAVALCSRTWGQWTRMDRRHAYLGDCHLSISWHLGAAESRLAFALARSPRSPARYRDSALARCRLWPVPARFSVRGLTAHARGDGGRGAAPEHDDTTLEKPF